MLDQVLANIFILSPDGLGMKEKIVKSAGDFQLGRPRSALEEILRVQN